MRKQKKDKEKWTDVFGYEGLYEISSFGRVRSCATSKCLKISKWRYASVCLRKTKKSYKNHSVHRLVLLSFVGPCPEGMQCRHLDGNPNNNRLDNLIWGTPKENAEDRDRHGRTMKGCLYPTSKGGDLRRKAVYDLYDKMHYTISKLAMLFSSSEETITNILNTSDKLHA